MWSSLAGLVWDSLCFLDLDTCSFPRLRKFSVIVSTNTPFSLSSFRDPYNVNVSMLLVPVISLNYPHFFSFFFWSASVISTTVSSNSLICFYHLVYYWYHLVYFSFLDSSCLVVLYIFSLLNTSNFSLYTNADSRAPLQPNWVSLCTLSSPSGASAHLRFEKHSSSVAHGPWGWHANSYKLMVIPSHLALHGSSHVPRSFQVKFPLRREIRTHPWLF